jgi:hypothetical protein
VSICRIYSVPVHAAVVVHERDRYCEWKGDTYMSKLDTFYILLLDSDPIVTQNNELDEDRRLDNQNAVKICRTALHAALELAHLQQVASKPESALLDRWWKEKQAYESKTRLDATEYGKQDAQRMDYADFCELLENKEMLRLPDFQAWPAAVRRSPFCMERVRSHLVEAEVQGPDEDVFLYYWFRAVSAYWHEQRLVHEARVG